MLQIVWNWMLVAVFPLLAGLLFRWLLRRWRRGWLLTAGAVGPDPFPLGQHNPHPRQ